MNHHHNFKDNQQFARLIEILDKPERKKSLPPEDLLRRLPIKDTDSILDLGAGTGYLTIPAAKMVRGFVYALDLDSRMLDIINAKAQQENLTNIQLINESMDNLSLNDGSIDIAVASLVLHEVNHLSKTLLQINRVLKEGGYFLCLEFEKLEDTPAGPPRIPSSHMEQELIHAGFDITQKLFLKDNSYIFIAKK